MSTKYSTSISNLKHSKSQKKMPSKARSNNSNLRNVISATCNINDSDDESANNSISTSRTRPVSKI